MADRNIDFCLNPANCWEPLPCTFNVLSTSRPKSKNKCWIDVVMILVFQARWRSHKYLIHLITRTSTTYFFCNHVTLYEVQKINKNVWITDFWLGICRRVVLSRHSMIYTCCLVWRNIIVIDGVTLSIIPTLWVCLNERKFLLFDSPTQYYIFQFPLAAYHCYVLGCTNGDYRLLRWKCRASDEVYRACGVFAWSTI